MGPPTGLSRLAIIGRVIQGKPIALFRVAGYNSPMKFIDDDITKALEVLNKGGVIAYPTEAVFGLGCDPYNSVAVHRILGLKQRPFESGFILVGSQWDQLEPFVEALLPATMLRVRESWPGPITWIFPVRPEIPEWITGNRKTIAVRVSAHPVVQEICKRYGKAIISTSANIHGNAPARDARTVELIFGNKIDFILKASVGDQISPTEIRNAITGEIIRMSDNSKPNH
jgi:L-threonylcarbamoyladenylate synthase